MSTVTTSGIVFLFYGVGVFLGMVGVSIVSWFWVWIFLLLLLLSSDWIIYSSTGKNRRHPTTRCPLTTLCWTPLINRQLYKPFDLISVHQIAHLKLTAAVYFLLWSWILCIYFLFYVHIFGCKYRIYLYIWYSHSLKKVRIFDFN